MVAGSAVGIGVIVNIDDGGGGAGGNGGGGGDDVCDHGFDEDDDNDDVDVDMNVDDDVSDVCDDDGSGCGEALFCANGTSFSNGSPCVCVGINGFITFGCKSSAGTVFVGKFLILFINFFF